MSKVKLGKNKLYINNYEILTIDKEQIELKKLL